jgi:ABC-type enterochelin transport system permease subunit
MRVGRTVAVAVLGFLFMLFVSLDLVLFGVVALNSVVVTILPLLGLIFGVVIGIVAGDRRAATDEPTIQNGSPV